MDIPLPKFQSLEERIRQLSEELIQIRKKNLSEADGSSSSVSEESGKQIERRIRRILEMLDEF